MPTPVQDRVLDPVQALDPVLALAPALVQGQGLVQELEQVPAMERELRVPEQAARAWDPEPAWARAASGLVMEPAMTATVLQTAQAMVRAMAPARAAMDRAPGATNPSPSGLTQDSPSSLTLDRLPSS